MYCSEYCYSTGDMNQGWQQNWMCLKGFLVLLLSKSYHKDDFMNSGGWFKKKYMLCVNLQEDCILFPHILYSF